MFGTQTCYNNVPYDVLLFWYVSLGRKLHSEQSFLLHSVYRCPLLPRLLFLFLLVAAYHDRLIPRIRQIMNFWLGFRRGGGIQIWGQNRHVPETLFLQPTSKF